MFLCGIRSETGGILEELRDLFSQKFKIKTIQRMLIEFRALFVILQITRKNMTKMIPVMSENMVL